MQWIFNGTLTSKISEMIKYCDQCLLCNGHLSNSWIYLFIVCFWWPPLAAVLLYFYYVALFVGWNYVLCCMHGDHSQQTEIFHNFSSNSHSNTSSSEHDKSAHWNTNSCGFKLTVELFKKGFLTKFEPKIGFQVTLWTSSKSPSHGQTVIRDGKKSLILFKRGGQKSFRLHKMG